jgi:hypothetical protein
VGGARGIATVVVHVHQLDAWPAPEGAEHQAADPSEAVDADAQGTGAGSLP